MCIPTRIIGLVVLCALMSGCGSNVVQWDEADDRVGDTVEVCGPIMSVRHITTAGRDVSFVNVGVDYPDPDRFTFVVFGRNLGDESDVEGAVIACAEGEISWYRGVTQMRTSEVTISNSDLGPN